MPTSATPNPASTTRMKIAAMAANPLSRRIVDVHFVIEAHRLAAASELQAEHQEPVVAERVRVVADLASGDVFREQIGGGRRRKRRRLCENDVVTRYPGQCPGRIAIRVEHVVGRADVRHGIFEDYV